MPNPDLTAIGVNIGDVGWMEDGGFVKLFNVMKSVSSSVGGAQYLIGMFGGVLVVEESLTPVLVGLSLRKPHDDNIALLAGDISQALGNDLDAALLGNVS